MDQAVHEEGEHHGKQPRRGYSGWSRRWRAVSGPYRIQENTRLIPVVLDGLQPADLPVAIRHLLFEPVADRAQIGGVVDRVVRSVYGKTDKPPLGAPPVYAHAESADIPGLDRVDALVLKAIGDEAVRDCGVHLQTEQFLGKLRDLDVSEHQGIESLEVLYSDGYIEIARTIGAGLPSMAHFRLTNAGLEAYATTFVDGYDRLRQAVLSRLAGWASDQGTDEELARQAQAPRLLALHILKQLDARGLLRLSQPLGPWAYFHGVSPKLRRMT
jgi:hypothetical protein